jgi:hypothetical protein
MYGFVVIQGRGRFRCHFNGHQLAGVDVGYGTTFALILPMTTSRFLVASFIAAVSVFGAGCAAETGDAPVDSNEEDVIAATEPLAMPKEILTFEKQNNWGTHHLMWHTERQWDLLGASDQAWAKKQGWARADIQEGAKGNGLEFLAMHRVMIRMLSEKFPKHAALFNGWTTVPTDPNDKTDPLPNGAEDAFDPAKLPALDKLANHLADLKSDDEIGLYLETAHRPTASNPKARSTDAATGIHNYVHNRFADQNSKIDIGDPSVNLQNKRFWRLHGYIESRWTAFRTLKHLTETDPAYAAAISKAEQMLTPTKSLPGGPYGGSAPEPPPDSLRKFFEQND